MEMIKRILKEEIKRFRKYLSTLNVERKGLIWEEDKIVIAHPHFLVVKKIPYFLKERRFFDLDCEEKEITTFPAWREIFESIMKERKNGKEILLLIEFKEFLKTIRNGVLEITFLKDYAYVTKVQVKDIEFSLEKKIGIVIDGDGEGRVVLNVEYLKSVLNSVGFGKMIFIGKLCPVIFENKESIGIIMPIDM